MKNTSNKMVNNTSKKPRILSPIIAIILFAICIVLIGIAIFYLKRMDNNSYLLKEPDELETTLCSISNMTQADYRNMQQRSESANKYKDFLKLNGQGDEVDNLPFDVLEQRVYDLLPTKDETYNVCFYPTTQEIENPTWETVLDLTTDLQFTNVTKDSKNTPDYVKQDLKYGYQLVQLDGSYYIKVTTFANLDLTDWNF